MPQRTDGRGRAEPPPRPRNECTHPREIGTGRAVWNSLESRDRARGAGEGADCSVCMVNFQCWGEGMKMRIRSTARQDSHRSYAARRLKLCCGVINDATSSHLGRKRAFILERERRPIIVPLNPILQGSSDPRRAGDRSNKPETSETYRPGVKSDQSPHAHSETEEGGRGRPGGRGAFSSLHCLTPFFLSLGGPTTIAAYLRTTPSRRRRHRRSEQKSIDWPLELSSPAQQK